MWNDALPGIGHACGHNLIAGASVGAGIGLYFMKEDSIRAGVDRFGELADKLTACHVVDSGDPDPWSLSGHCPVIAEFDL